MDIENYPYAFFEIHETKLYKGEENYQWEIIGDLTIKEAVIPLLIVAKALPSGSNFIIEADSEIDLPLLGLNKDGQLELAIELLIKG